MNKQTITPNSNTLAAAFRRHQAGELELAQTLYRQILQTEPQHAEALHLLGLLYHQTGRSGLAIDAIRQAIEQEGDNSLYWNSLALVNRETGHLAAAAGCYRRLLQLTPEDAGSHHALGVILAELGQSTEAIACFRQTVDLQQDHADALYNLGVLLGRLRQHDEAVACYRRVLGIRPDYAGAAYNLAVLLRRQNRIDEALDYYRQATALRPDNVFWQLEQDTIFPLVMPNSQAIDDWRADIATAFSHYPPGSIDLATHLPAITASNALPTLYLNYHGRNDRVLKEQYARLFSVNGPLAAPPVARRTAPPYRLGFVVTGRHEGIFLRMVGGLLDQLDPNQFTISLICPAASVERLRTGLERDDITFLSLTSDLPASIQGIKAQQLDLVYFWEVGSDSLNYFLPFFRLAPLQVTSWGSMGTTGLPHMDTYISSRYFEPPDAADYYSEQLVQLDSLLTYVERPTLPQPLKPRAAFGLPADAHLYLCPQNLLKIHPDFDAILAQILRRDPAGQLLFISGPEPQWQAQLLARWQTKMPDVLERIQFLPRQDYPDYLNLLALANVVLDTIHFNGGATTYDALAAGAPVVTMPTGLMRGRMTAGCYRRMGVSDCIADSPATYVDLAVGLATQPQFRETIEARILAANHRLYQDKETVRELERCLERIIEKAPIIQPATGAGSRKSQQDDASSSANGNITANFAAKLLPVASRHPKGNLVHLGANKAIVLAHPSTSSGCEKPPPEPVEGDNLSRSYLSRDVLEADGKSYRHTLGNDPTSAETWYHLGLEARQNGQPETAIDYLNQAVALDEANARSYYALGSICEQLNRRLEAIQNLRQAVTLEPELAEAWYDLGFLLAKEKRWAEAERCYRVVVRLQPNNATAHYQLGGALWQQKKIEASVENFRRTVELKPEQPMAYAFLAQGLAALGFRDKAIANYEKALEFRPDDAALHNNLGGALMGQKRNQEAKSHFARALALTPDRAVFHFNLGSALEQLNQYKAAKENFEQAVKRDSTNPLWQLKAASVCPAITPKKNGIARWRSQFAAALDQFSPGSIDLVRWLPQLHSTGVQAPFNLHYHGLDDRILKEKYARLFNIPQPHQTPRRTKPGESQKHRIGFLVTHGHEGVFSKFMLGLISRLDKTQFDPFVITHLGSTELFRANTDDNRLNYLTIGDTLSDAIQKIRAAEFDLIYYWEVGTDALNYFLPFFRLAPVQCTSWGSPTTTGIPQLDYFISSELFEPAGAESHYSEQLVRLKTFGTWYTPPQIPSPLKPRAYFGLSEAHNLYLCVQNLNKYHHDFDEILGEILRCDPQGQLLIKANQPQLDHVLRQRWQQTIPDVLPRIQFLPNLSYADYLNLMAVVDVLLDTPHYTGGTTAHEAAAVGTPMVTWPGKFMRGRMAYGFYQKMGVLDCVAWKVEEYTAKAVQIATDREYREYLSQEILLSNHRLFEDEGAVKELGQFLEQVIIVNLAPHSSKKEFYVTNSRGRQHYRG